MRTYPTSTANPNVPRGAYLIAEWPTMSGEITHTLYALPDLTLWYVTDWSGDQPRQAAMFEACRATLDTEETIHSRVRSWFHHQEATP